MIVGKTTVLEFVNQGWPPVCGELTRILPSGVVMRNWMFARGELAGVVQASERFYPFNVLYCVEQDPNVPPKLPIKTQL